MHYLHSYDPPLIHRHALPGLRSILAWEGGW